MLLKLKRPGRPIFWLISVYIYLRDIALAIDWKLLTFLVFFLNVKMAIKVLAIITIYLLQPDVRFGFRIKQTRLPLFYPMVIIVAIINWIIGGLFLQSNYNIVFLTGISFWCLCILALHQVKLMVEKNKLEVINRTITAFFILNIIASLSIYLKIVLETGTINPFTYQGQFQKYFIGTGDYIKGITLDTSVTNAILSSFGVIYYLNKKNGLLCVLNMAVLLLTGSNFINIVFSIVLLFIFIFQSNKDQKSLVVVCLIMMLIFILKISPQNEKYVTSWYNRLFSTPAISKQLQPILITKTDNRDPAKEKIAKQYVDSISAVDKQKKKPVIIENLSPQSISVITGKPIIPQPNINGPFYQHKEETTEVQKTMKEFICKNQDALRISTVNSLPNSKYPGKIISLQQTFNYLAQHPQQILTGTGIGNFSSKLAFRATAMNIAGGYPGKFSYISNEFKSNHFDLYLYYFSRQAALHSVINSPNSTYDQLLSEYGLIGLLAFLIFYVGFFLKNMRQLTYGIPLLLLMSAAFFIDYWFEQLSVIIILELLLLLNIKETKTVHLYNE